MWETLFDPSMLDSGKEIAIWCPNAPLPNVP